MTVSFDLDRIRTWWEFHDGVKAGKVMDLPQGYLPEVVKTLKKIFKTFEEFRDLREFNLQNGAKYLASQLNYWVYRHTPNVKKPGEFLLSLICKIDELTIVTLSIFKVDKMKKATVQRFVNQNRVHGNLFQFNIVNLFPFIVSNKDIKRFKVSVEFGLKQDKLIKERKLKIEEQVRGVLAPLLPTKVCRLISGFAADLS